MVLVMVLGRKNESTEKGGRGGFLVGKFCEFESAIEILLSGVTNWTCYPWTLTKLVW